MIRIALVLVLSFAALLEAAPPAAVLTRSASNLRHGAYPQETDLTPANVGNLKLLYSVAIPGDRRGIESQPLVAPQVKLAEGSTHDLLVLSTMANDILAYDFADGKLLWKVNLGNPITGSKAIDFWTINDHWGILSTGVIDPDTQTLYSGSHSITI